MADVTLQGTPSRSADRSESRAERAGLHRPRQRAQARQAPATRRAGRDLMPSLDTPTCDTETRRFNQEAAKLGARASDLDDQPRPALRAEALVRHRGVTAVKTLSIFGRAFGPPTASRSGRADRRTHRARGVRGRQGRRVARQYVKESGRAELRRGARRGEVDRQRLAVHRPGRFGLAASRSGSRPARRRRSPASRKAFP